MSGTAVSRMHCIIASLCVHVTSRDFLIREASAGVAPGDAIRKRGALSGPELERCGEEGGGWRCQVFDATVLQEGEGRSGESSR